MNQQPEISEKWVIGILCAVQFVNVLDFMMVIPMGPDFAAGLGIELSKLGSVAGSYTFAASIAGVLGSFFLDRFDRKKAMLVSMLGLAVGTFLGGFSTNLVTLLAARCIAGVFGGTTASLALSIVSDIVPPARRGKAMGVVMGSFSLASVFGVPLGLEVARLGGWRMPFFGLAALCIIVLAFASWKLPSIRLHLNHPTGKSSFRGLLRHDVLLSYAMTALVMLGAFLMIPNFSAFFQFNLHFPREKLGVLYLIGGTLSFFVMRMAGKWIDKIGTLKVALVATAGMAFILVTGYIIFPPVLSPFLIFALFMISTSSRNVSAMSLGSRVPHLHERARYMSFQSAVQHLFAAIGAFISSAMLTETAEGKLQGMPQLASLSLCIALVVPFLIAMVEKKVVLKESAALKAEMV